MTVYELIEMADVALLFLQHETETLPPYIRRWQPSEIAAARTKLASNLRLPADESGTGPREDAAATPERADKDAWMRYAF